MKRFSTLSLAVAASAFLFAGAGSRAAHAQIAPYAAFSLGHYSGLGVGVGTSNTQSGGMTALGGTFGAYGIFENFPGGVRLGGDARFLIENSANSTPYGNKLAGGLFGVRLDGGRVPFLPVNPYGQFEIGAVGQNNGTSYNKTTSFAYQFQFGGDFAVTPILAARAEYGLGQLSTGSNSATPGVSHHTLQTLTVGLVLHNF